MNHSILIADSDELVRDLLTIRLSSFGYRCHAVPDGEAALSYLTHAAVNLVIMDTMMPMLSGAETLVRIRANPTMSHIPVLMLCQKTTPAERQMVLALGAAGYVTKPFCSEELLTLVAKLLEGPHGKAVRRLKVTVMGAAALTAALPAVAQAAEAQHAQPAPFVGPEASGLISTVTLTGDNVKDVGQPIPAPRPDLQSPSMEVAPLPEATGDPWHKRHSLTLVQGRSWVSGSGSPDWNDTTLAYSIRPTARSGYAVEANRAERFGLTDTQLSVRGDWQVGPRTSVFVAAVATPSARLREKQGLRAGFSHTLMTHLEVGASSRLGTFVDGNKLAVTPYIALSSKGETVTLVAEFINLWNLEGPADYRTGYGLRLRTQPTSRLRTLAGFARYPEVELGTARTVRSIYGGLSYDLSESVGLSGSYASDRYENLFTRNGVSVGLTYRWRGAG